MLDTNELRGLIAKKGLEERNGYPDITETETFYNKMKFCDRLRLHFQEHI